MITESLTLPNGETVWVSLPETQFGEAQYSKDPLADEHFEDR